MKVSYKQISIMLPHFSSESDSVFRLAPVCPVVSLAVCSMLQCSCCIPVHWWWVERVSDQVQYPGTVQFDRLQLWIHDSTIEGFSRLNLRIQVFPCLSLCIWFSEDCRSVWIHHRLTNTQSRRHALPFSHLESDCETMLRCVCLSGSLPTLHRLGSRSQASRCGKHP